MMMDLIPRKDVIDYLENLIKYYDRELLIVKKDSTKHAELRSKIQLLSHLIVEIEEMK